MGDEDFEFKIGEEVHSKLHKLNSVIAYRMVTETIDDRFNEYGVMFHKEDGSYQRVEMLQTAWLQPGHRHDL